MAGTCGYSGTKILPELCCYLLGEPGLVLHDVQRGVLDVHVLHAEPRHDHLLVAPLLLHDVQRGVLVGLVLHAEPLDDLLVSLVFHGEPLDDLLLLILLLLVLPGSCFFFQIN